MAQNSAYPTQDKMYPAANISYEDQKQTAPIPAYTYPNIPPQQQGPPYQAPQYQTPQYPVPPQQGPPYQAPQYQTPQFPVPPQQVPNPPSEGCFKKNHKNKPQSNSVGAAALIFTTAGMNIAWGVGFSGTLYTYYTIYVNICWFLMAIIGAFASAILINKVPKKIFMSVSSVLVVLGGLLMLAIPNNSDSIMAARHLNGFATGLIVVPTAVMAGEEVVKDMRGMVSSSIETMCISLGIFLQLLYASLYTFDMQSSFTLNQVHGLICLIFGALSLVFAFILVIESPIYFLVRGREQDAIDCLRRLQRPFTITWETYAQLDEHKKYIEHNKQMLLGDSIIEALPALLKLCIVRLMVAFSFSRALNSAFALTSLTGVGVFSSWPYTVYGLCRYVGSFIGMFTIESVGRKKTLMVGLTICGICLMAVAGISDSMYDYQTYGKLRTMLFFLFVYQLFAGFYATSSSAYMTEAFPLGVKHYCIAIAFSFEMLGQILIASIYSAAASYMWAIGVLSVLFAVLTVVCLPETKKTTLLEAQKMFRRFLNTKLD